ncbi:lytic murein transglycosylase [Gymnodinialimonas ceratoperidinii]|uniref:Lytic murein transglycosylase n=1 Tax=Gymnodinialimonas ceratoperidinii TaxID=2856823 RepID=A0A8F6YCC6_9RHOB|nr:lytic murein transglycosylase [Gymnodinialimonas ceratoperidinii]QXT41408.1 lytic murein transglycosylase [Gymnodinialimonas ceratoperidinii]
MQITRRSFGAGAASLGLSGCVGGIGGVSLGGGGIGAIGASGASGPSNDPDFRPQPNASYDAWLTGFRSRARAAGISEDAVSRGLRGAGYLPGVIERDRNQTEFRRSTEDYLALVAGEDDVRSGRSRFASQRSMLAEIEGRYGVPAEVCCAVWGVESRYGTRLGDIPVISAVTTLAWEGRRGNFFEAQAIAALRIVQNGDTTPERMLGSWAGAMGHTQFIPTTYEEYAVDFRGDGRRDIWSSDPTDALASTASYFNRFGWRTGEPWGMEVQLPSGFSASTGRDTRRSVAAWRDLGVRRAGGGALPDHGSAAIHAPGGAGAPAWILFHNFGVILRYNNSINYGIGVGYLADRIAGGGPLRQSFGADASGLTQAQRRELQELLNRAGYDAGTPDGVVGSGTEAAIEAYQAANGLPVTGEPSAALLRRLR